MDCVEVVDNLSARNIEELSLLGTTITFSKRNFLSYCCKDRSVESSVASNCDF